MEESPLRITHRRLPHWSKHGCVYFVSFRLEQGTLSDAERRIVLAHLRNGHGKFYLLAAAVVMPDHVHFIIKPLADYTLSRIMKGVKGASARLINEARGTSGRVWQEESWDRIIRDEKEFEQKLQYMLDNPIKAGLSKNGWDYEGWYFNPDFD